MSKQAVHIPTEMLSHCEPNTSQAQVRGLVPKHIPPPDVSSVLRVFDKDIFSPLIL